MESQNEWLQRVCGVDGIGKSVQQIKNRLSRRSSAPTLPRRARQKVVPAQTDLKVKYFYTVGQFVYLRCKSTLNRFRFVCDRFFPSVTTSKLSSAELNRTLIDRLDTFSDAIDLANTLVPFISRHLPGIHLNIPCDFFFHICDNIAAKKYQFGESTH